MGKRRIYVYTTPAESALGHIKVGMTERDEPGKAGVIARISEQFGTANSSKDYTLLDWWPSEITDHDLRRHRLLADTRVSKDREWHKCTVDNVRIAYNELVNGVARKDNFQPRHEQQSCIDKAMCWFNSVSSDGRFLVNAKMRFGKTATTYWIAKALNCQRVLVLTYKPAVKSSWRDDLLNHVDFAGWTFNDVAAGDCGSGVYFSSMQGMLSGAESRNWAFSEQWDLIVLDEEHYGTRSQRAQEVYRSFTKAKRFLSLSGTPFRALLGGEFRHEQTFTWSYEDEQRAKKAHAHEGLSSPYAALPTMHFLTYDFSEQLRQSNARLYSKDEQFTISKLFAANQEKFESPGAVNSFLDLLAGDEAATGVRQKLTSPWHAAGVTPETFAHTLWVMPSVAAVNAMAQTLRLHHHFRHFDVLTVSGDDSESSVDALKEKMKRPKTLTLTCQRFKEGVTVPKWDAVFFLDDGRSPTSYFQAAFRAQSPCKMETDPVSGAVTRWKESCYVVDFNPHRLLEMVYDKALLMKHQAVNTDKPIRHFVSTILECAPIYQHGHAAVVEASADDVMRVAVTSKDFADRFGSAFAVDAVQADQLVVEALLGVEAAKSPSLSKQVTDADIQRGKTKSTVREKAEKDATQVDKKLLAQLQAQAASLLRRIPSYLFVTPSEKESCDDIILRGDAALFEAETGVTLQAFGHMLDIGFIDREHLDTCVLSFAELKRQVAAEQTLADRRQKLWDLLSRLHMSGTSTVTPVTLVDEMLSKLPPETWTDPTKTFLDPACGTGSFYVALACKLNDGLQNVMPDEAERLSHIFGKMLFACDVDGLQLQRMDAVLRTLGVKHLMKNVYNEDSLRRKWEMKFNVVLGNPPYNLGKTGGGSGAGNACWQKFVSIGWELLDEEGYLCFVHPPEWRTNRFSRSNKLSSNIIFNSSILWNRAAFPFPGAGCTVDAYVLQKSQNRQLTEWVNSDGSVQSLMIDPSTSFLANMQSEMIDNISHKVLSLPVGGNGLKARKAMGGLVIYDREIEGDYTFVSGATFKKNQHKHPHIHQFLPKVIMSDSRDFRPFYDDGNLGIGDHVHYILVKEKDEANNVINFINSRLSRFFQWVFCEGYDAKNGRHGGEPWNSPIPLSMVQFFHCSDDSSIYTHFGLTQEEIDYIEKSVK